MKIYDQYDHLNAFKLIQDRNLYPELVQIVNNPNLVFGKKTPSEIKKMIEENFNNKGWADKVKIATSNLTINFIKDGVGVCFQIGGNVARTYADILKLMLLHNKGRIEIGVIFVPSDEISKTLGKNYARYNRLERELMLYKDIITVPILAIGLSNS